MLAADEAECAVAPGEAAAAPVTVDASRERHRGLEVLRALATTSTVVTHAVIAYMVLPLPSMAWPVHDAGSPGVDIAFVWFRGAGVKIFFVLAGYFAAHSIARQGPAEMLRSRLRRVGLPLLVGCFTVLPVMYLVWGLGWVRSGYATLRQVMIFGFATPDKQRLLGLAHLWYLEYLLILLAGYAVWRKLLPRGWTLGKAGFAAVLCVGAAVMGWCVWCDPGLMTDFRNGVLPRALSLIFHLPLFVTGALLGGRSFVPGWCWAVLWLMAQALFALGQWAPAKAGPDAASAVTGVWVFLSAVAAVGCASGWRAPAKATLLAQPVARASYAIYMWHLPVVGIVAIAFYHADVEIWIKIAVATVLGVAIPLALAGLRRPRRITAPAS